MSWETARQDFRSTVSSLSAAFAAASLSYTLNNDSGDSVIFTGNGRQMQIRLLDEGGNITLRSTGRKVSLATIRPDAAGLATIIAEARKRDADLPT